jgi:hypothetical protein
MLYYETVTLVEATVGADIWTLICVYISYFDCPQTDIYTYTSIYIYFYTIMLSYGLCSQLDYDGWENLICVYLDQLTGKRTSAKYHLLRKTHCPSSYMSSLPPYF